MAEERYGKNHSVSWEDAAEWVKAFEEECHRTVLVLCQPSMAPNGRLRWYVNLKSFTNLTNEWKAASEVAGGWYPSNGVASVPALILNLVVELEHKVEDKRLEAERQTKF